MNQKNEKSVIIRPLAQSDFAAWSILWDGYNTFYKRTVSEEITQTAWTRFLDPREPMHALVAEKEGTLVGMTHYLFHRNTAMIHLTCYLQDLFTAEEARGNGVGRALIEAVCTEAKKEGSPRVYWQTHETNEVAMKLYDQVAVYSGFLVYQKRL